MDYLIKNGLVVDPVNNIEELFDVIISEGKINKLGKNLKSAGCEIIDAKGLIVAPGLVDMHVHLREPGREDKETVLSGTRAAVKGGFTTIACMPNTDPAIDTPEMARALKSIIKKDALINVSMVGAITRSRAGNELVDLIGMKKEGIVAISDDGSSVEKSSLMEEALKAATKCGLLVIAHCEDQRIANHGVINKGFMSTKMGLRGMSKRAEYEIVARDIELAKKTNSKIHIAHVSCKESVDIIRKAKAFGVQVTAETAPHYFSLTEECSATYDTNTKMNPPLRTKEDVEAIKRGLKDGTIDVIATDHAPHTDAEKDVEFDYAPFGIIGLETALSLAVMELVDKKVISWKDLILKMSVNPAKLLGLEHDGIREGATADMVIIDPKKEYVYTKDSIESKSKNTPFLNWTLKGKASYIFKRGKCVMRGETIV